MDRAVVSCSCPRKNFNPASSAVKSGLKGNTLPNVARKGYKNIKWLEVK